MELKLVVIGGKQAGQIVPVAGPKFFIGRSEECQLRPNSDLISRHHCAIMVDEGMATVRDLGSKNGTFVNDQRIRGEEELKTGDTLTVGPLHFQVRLEVGLEASKKPKVQTVEEAATRTVESAGAPTKAEDGELDISDWLGGDETDPMNDTQTLDRADSGTVSVGGAGTTVSTFQPEPVEPTEEQAKPDKKSKETPGRLPNIKKPKAVDSQAAAADVLRHFFRRK
ncbi:MAG: FHA domain-containing protein [Pirellulales bacterium]|nr:FHA domain-containing protein [Pirellulales bacterium]